MVRIGNTRLAGLSNTLWAFKPDNVPSTTVDLEEPSPQPCPRKERAAEAAEESRCMVCLSAQVHPGLVRVTAVLRHHD